MLEESSNHAGSPELPMKQKSTLELSDVKTIATAAEAEALENKWAVSIAIVDDGGQLLWLQRLDGAPPNSMEIAQAKARTSAQGRRDSALYEQMINSGRIAFLGSGIVGVLEGGVLIRHDGHCVGAIGVSGVTPAEDTQIATAGAKALGS